MPGVGLLLLRTAIGLVTAWQGATLVASADSAWLENGTGLIAILVAAALIVGLLTPCAAALVAIGAAVSASRIAGQGMMAHDGLVQGLLLIDAVSLVLLGPGAFSVDARLFGRREIHIRESVGAPRD
jgi:uncharacterized membrane protein YphA (DoxX/SURF4 family)